MHTHTIAVTLAMAGSSLAAALQSPPSMSYTTVTTDEIRAYGPTCAGVGPDAYTPAASEEPKESEESEELAPEEHLAFKMLDLNGDGEIHDHELDEWTQHLDDELSEGELAQFDPPTIVIAPPTLHDDKPTGHVGHQTVRIAPLTVRKTDPSMHNPDWKKHALLNDTRKQVNGFKLFAEFGKGAHPLRYALHVREHENRKDIWNVKMVPAFKLIPSGPGAEEPTAAQDSSSLNTHQPRWNLADNRLETRSNESAPVNDTLYFRLYDAKVKKDTTELKGPVLRSVLTTNPNKHKYGKEGNVKMLAKKSWQLQRDTEEPHHYKLQNKDVKGNFFWCLHDATKMAALKRTVAAANEDQNMAMSNIADYAKLVGDHNDSELVYADSLDHSSGLLKFNKGGAEEHCLEVTLKVTLMTSSTSCNRFLDKHR